MRAGKHEKVACLSHHHSEKKEGNIRWVASRRKAKTCYVFWSENTLIEDLSTVFIMLHLHFPGKLKSHLNLRMYSSNKSRTGYLKPAICDENEFYDRRKGSWMWKGGGLSQQFNLVQIIKSSLFMTALGACEKTDNIWSSCFAPLFRKGFINRRKINSLEKTSETLSIQFGLDSMLGMSCWKVLNFTKQFG